MSNNTNLFCTKISETCEYFCRLVLKECKADDELLRLLASFRKFAWAIEAMANKLDCDDIKEELVCECITIALFLMDKITKEFSELNK